MASKSISFCSSSYYEYDRRMQRIINSLLEADHKVSWISRRFNSKSEEFKTVTHAIVNPLFRRGPLFYLGLNFRIFIRLIFQKVDIISAVDLDTLPAAYMASIIKRKPLVFDAHEIYYEVPELLDKPIKKKIWKALASWIIPGLKHNYTVNNSLKKHYEDRYNSPFKVIRNVPPKEDVEVDIAAKIALRHIVYIGAVNKDRGLEELIDAMSDLSEYQLTIVGDGDVMSSLTAKVEQMNLQSQITFTGFISPEKLPQILKEATVAVNLLRPASENYRLSLANKFFDYINALVPSINMNFPEYQSINEAYEVSVLVDELSSQNVVTAIKSLEDYEKYSSLVEKCKMARLVYNWESESQNLIEIYNSI